MDNDPEVDAIIAEMVDFGVLQPNGMYGEEFTYNVDMKSAKKHFPEFYQMLMQDVDDTMLELVKHDLVSVNYDENLTASFEITEKGKEVLEDGNHGEYFSNESFDES
jgi:hypothetical protein